MIHTGTNRVLVGTKVKEIPTYTTSDNKVFDDIITAKFWDDYLTTKTKLSSDFSISEFSLSKIGAHFNLPIFGYRFKISKSEDLKSLVPFFAGLLVEHAVGEHGYIRPNIDEILKEVSKASHRGIGWFAFIYHEDMSSKRVFQIVYLPDFGYQVPED